MSQITPNSAIKVAARAAFLAIMFEAQAAYYLNRYLGAYLDGLDPQSLKISVFKGNVVLRNLQLKPEALNELDLPVVVKAGLLGTLTLKVPWSALGKVPVEVQMDRLYILASPAPEREHSKGVDDPVRVCVPCWCEAVDGF